MGEGWGRGGGEGDERDVVGGCVRWEVGLTLLSICTCWCGSTPPTGVMCRSSVHAWFGLLNQHEF